VRAGAVVVHDGAWYAIAVVPAGARLDLGRLRRLTRRWGLCLADEGALPRPRSRAGTDWISIWIVP
jgi:hypothetical protein